MKKKSLVSALCLTALCSVPAQAALVLVDDFEGVNSFSGGTIIVDPLNPANKVLSFGSVESSTAIRNLSAGERIPDGAVGTLFFQANIPGDNRDVSLGLSEQDQADGFPQYLSQVLFLDGNNTVSNPNFVQVRNGNGAGGGPSPTVIADPVENSLYNFWMVMDEPAGLYDLYVQGPGFASQTLIADNFGFRRSFAPGNIDRILLKEGGNGSGNILFDNFYIDTTGINLANPTAIPEPASLALLGLVALAIGARRKTRA